MCACVCMCVIKGFELMFYSGKMTHKCKKNYIYFDALYQAHSKAESLTLVGAGNALLFPGNERGSELHVFPYTDKENMETAMRRSTKILVI